jgi:anti-anti-sigma factor
MDDFRVSLEARPPLAIISVSGELDIATAPDFRRSVESTLEEDFQRLLFDLSKLRFMDSTGVQIVLEAHQRLGQDNVAICAPAPIVRKVFEALGLTGQIVIYGDCDEALSHVQASPAGHPG